MSAPKIKPSTPAVAVDLQTAAALVDLSYDVFAARVLPELRVIEVTPRCRRIAVSELERWCDSHAEAVNA
jgi:hypothetical protein